MAEKKSAAPAAKAAKSAPAATSSAAAGAKAGAKDHDVKPSAVTATVDKAGPDKKDPEKHSRFSGSAQVAKGFQGKLVEIFKGLWSSDGPTRWMSLFFFLSLVALAGVGVLAVQRSIRQSNVREAMAIAAEEEAAARTKEAAFLGKTKVAGAEASKASMISVGQFTIELKGIPGAAQEQGDDQYRGA